MLYPPELSAWTRTVSSQMPHLTRRQAAVLAVYSFAVMLTQSSGMSHVSCFLAYLLRERENTVRQRLREWLYDAQDKRGSQRQAVVVEQSFAALLRWVVRLWQSVDGEMVLALDATTLRQTFTVLSVSVVVGRCAIPVAWAIVPATQAGAWKPHWQRLLRTLKGNTSSYRVLVAADRGLYARWLFKEIVACGWHPLLRVNAVGSCLVCETGERWTLAALAQQVRGGWWHGRVVCFSCKASLTCTLLVLWDEGQKDVWLLLTNCPPQTVSPTWYGLRMWIEAGFKSLKSGAFHWQRTRMTHPARAERLWLVLALALLGSLSLADFQLPLPPPYPRLSLVKRGLLLRLAAALQHALLPAPALHFPSLPPSPLLEFIPLLKTYP
jgi:hypothetical protein